VVRSAPGRPGQPVCPTARHHSPDTFAESHQTVAPWLAVDDVARPAAQHAAMS
jgi:hypothetical protein